MKYTVLSINPGSTTTKVALFENEMLIFSDSEEHKDALLGFDEIIDQLDYRTEVVYSILKRHHVDLSRINAVVGRGGQFYSLISGLV